MKTLESILSNNLSFPTFKPQKTQFGNFRNLETN